MESKLVQTFVKHVNELITSEQERDTLFEALKKYQSSSDVKRLVQDLKRLINEPLKLEIYDYIRPLIRPQHQQHYDKLAPNAPGQRLRVIKLHRRAPESFGFAVRGGFEHGVGIFVSHVEPGSQADQKGLKMGDEVVRVNGFTIAEAIHEEVLNLIKGREEIELKVTNIGMVPIKQSATDPVTWQYVEKSGLAKSLVTGPYTEQENVVKIFINLHGAPGLGCSIISGPHQFPGIFIESVRPGSLGEDYALEVGDQIMEVNGKSFQNIKHKEAIVELKGCKELNMIIKKAVGLPLMNMKKKGVSPVLIRKEPQPSSQGDSGEVIGEILEQDLYATVEKQNWEQEREKLRKQKVEEEIRRQYHQHELRRKLEEEERELQERKGMEDGERREVEEIQRQLTEEDRIREAGEQRRREDDIPQLGELGIQQEMIAREDDRKKEEEEERKRQTMVSRKQQSAVLAGRTGAQSSMKPTLLGAAPGAQTVFGKSSTRTVKDVVIIMEEDLALDIELEGGVDSALDGKIVVSQVYPGGAIDKNGEIRKGDQILKINDENFENVSLSEANERLWQLEQECLPGNGVTFAVVESGLSYDEDTFF